MSPTGSPHDALFKAAFSLPENAAAELRHVLGPDVAARIDFTTLELCPGSFVGEALQSRHTDLLFKARIADEDARIFVLFEHKSNPEPYLALALLGYMVQIWEDYLREHPGARRLPIILPVVVAHGEGGWRSAANFAALCPAPDDLRPYVPQFRFALDDLGAEDPDSLQRREAPVFARLALLALQQARRTRDLGRLLRGWMDLLRILHRDPTGQRARDQLFRYLLMVCGDGAGFLETTATEVDQEAMDIMETYYEKWTRQGRESGLAEGIQTGRQEGIQTGRQEGIQTGRQEGIVATLLRILQRRFGTIPAAVERRVRGADIAELEQWIDRSVVASALDEVFTPG